MKLQQKREVVRLFKGDLEIYEIASWIMGTGFLPLRTDTLAVERILRDYMNRKFTLKGNAKK